MEVLHSTARERDHSRVSVMRFLRIGDVHGGVQPGLTGAGEEVPAAEHVVGRGCQQILGAAQSAKAKVPGGEHKAPLSFSGSIKYSPPLSPSFLQHTYFTGLASGEFSAFLGEGGAHFKREHPPGSKQLGNWSLEDQWLSGTDTTKFF